MRKVVVVALFAAFVLLLSSPKITLKRVDTRRILIGAYVLGGL